MITNERVTLDGKENNSEMWNSPKTTKGTWSGNCDTMLIESKVVFRRGDQTSEMTINESWSLQEKGKVLSIKQYSNSMWGERTITMIFNRE
jgi:hypothetical protein